VKDGFFYPCPLVPFVLFHYFLYFSSVKKENQIIKIKLILPVIKTDKTYNEFTNIKQILQL
jgi:hypothetical protein